MKSVTPIQLQTKSALSLLPTPLHKLNNLSQQLGHNIYCKRDDLTGFAGGGNKTRKLDYLLIDMKARTVDTIIAVGANQSNFCRVVAAAGAVQGYEVHLVLGENNSPAPTTNLLLDEMFGAVIHNVNSSNWNDWESEAAKLEKKLIASGKKVYALPIGGSTPVGALGYVNAFCEIIEDALRMNITFDVIVHATSSGGTQAGLLVGKSLTQWDGVVMGVGVAKDKLTLQNEVLELSIKTGRVFDVEVHRPDVVVDDNHIGTGYGIKTKEAEDAIQLFARTEGILLDHVYTGKTAAALIEYCRKGRFEKDQNILFLHTGGSIELFA